ncbi:MAG TPA: zinc-dependent metalloprotease [Chloroflexota bacterium]
MANGKLAFRAGVLLGVTAGALWVVAGRKWLDAEHELMDWDRVRDIALRTSGKSPLTTPWTSKRVQARYEEMVREVEDPIAAYTGSRLPEGRANVIVMGRREWIEANVANFRDLFEPVEQMYREIGRRTPNMVPGLAQISQLAVSSQIGLLVGYLSKRVLGQYDMSVLGREPMTSGRLYFVHQNIEGIESELELPGEEFRTWIVLHETTHAHEFEVHPWVRDYMNNTLRDYLDCVLDELRRSPGGSGGTTTAVVGRMIDNLRNGRSLLESVMSPRQQRYMDQMQALMCLLEGYSNHIMNAVGRTVLPHFDLIKQSIESKQKERSQVEKLFLKLTGLQMKMEQYRLGEQFVDRVVAQRGIAFANRAFEGPENLPTMKEVVNPGRWVARMDGAS